MNLGDLMALLSGILFAFGAMRVRQAPETSVLSRSSHSSCMAPSHLVLPLLPLAALVSLHPLTS
jgi:hypothetical protein